MFSTRIKLVTKVLKASILTTYLHRILQVKLIKPLECKLAKTWFLSLFIPSRLGQLWLYGLDWTLDINSLLHFAEILCRSVVEEMTGKGDYIHQQSEKCEHRCGKANSLICHLKWKFLAWKATFIHLTMNQWGRHTRRVQMHFSR